MPRLAEAAVRCPPRPTAGRSSSWIWKSDPRCCCSCGSPCSGRRKSHHLSNAINHHPIHSIPSHHAINHHPVRIIPSINPSNTSIEPPTRKNPSQALGKTDKLFTANLLSGAPVSWWLPVLFELLPTSSQEPRCKGMRATSEKGSSPSLLESFLRAASDAKLNCGLLELFLPAENKVLPSY